MPSPYAIRRPVDNAYLVRQRDRRRSRELLLIALAVVVVGTSLMVLTVMHQQKTYAAYRIQELEERLETHRETLRRLELEAAELSRPARIEAKARQMGLVEPRMEQVLFEREIAP